MPALFFVKCLHSCPLGWDPIDHGIGASFEIDSGSQVRRVFLQDLVEMYAGFGEPLSVVELPTALKGRFRLLLQLDYRLSVSLKHFLDGDRILSPFDTHFVDKAVPEPLASLIPPRLWSPSAMEELTSCLREKAGTPRSPTLRSMDTAEGGEERR
jgi:hypothetical protein